jgi:GNAT superfamily N-acetyltransferase
MIEIRNATGADAETIATLHAENWRIFYRGIWTDSFLDGEVYKDRLTVWKARFDLPALNQHVFLATESGIPLGFACLYTDDDTVHGSLLDNLHVIANSQGIGLGRQLIKTVAAACLQYSTSKSLYLWVLEENDKARKIYKHLGAISQGTVKKQHPDGSISNACRYGWKDVTQLVLF